MIQGINAAIRHEEHRHSTANHISEILAATRFVLDSSLMHCFRHPQVK